MRQLPEGRAREIETLEVEPCCELATIHRARSGFVAAAALGSPVQADPEALPGVQKPGARSDASGIRA